MIFEECLSFKESEFSTTFSFKSTASDMDVLARSIISPQEGEKGNQLTRTDSLPDKKPHLSLLESGNQRHQAALTLQKVYKSFRTRRQLADCAIAVEQRWWKLLEFAELKRSSISFFDIENPETAISRWSRARMRAAKVGKGLSKDAMARKLALQHWLEAIDPRHRYGHNLQFYFVNWLQCQSTQPFFYWLDIGSGKEVNLDTCPRSKLQQQCIKYLGPAEREDFEIAVENGKFLYKQSGEVLHTAEGLKDAKWIFVLSTSKTLYVGQKMKGTFQHSSFLAGAATLSAGRLVVENGVLKAVWPHSGHYLPTEENFQAFMSFLREHNVDLTNVKERTTDEEDESIIRKDILGSIRDQPDADLPEDTKATNAEVLAPENTVSRKQDSNVAENGNLHASKLSRGLQSKITELEIPARDMLATFETGLGPICQVEDPDSPGEDGYETAEDSFLTEEDFKIAKLNLFDDNNEEENEDPVPEEKLLQRIDSHKGMKSYQLEKQLVLSKWTTGAGPRIRCMKDYPPELRLWVLENANLSPRTRSDNSSPRPDPLSSPNVSSPVVLTQASLFKETSCRSPLAPDQVLISQTASL
ncbi:IQ DOMAIN-CONTAINING PROTEIN IQM6 [Salix koriyanagi]|uniref:IQ DOMAIN-CONTAINING PROTEIN IQM6 n=1 Tax=Salix koriyanagi TaxID=2511006 RepID=A0A9Q0X3I5_9ROSI|nr:IQ DOMAIN-CONTAINING PROTEIN IQM6 [Salix koriyanagi]